jgi:hypothetical protein
MFAGQKQIKREKNLDEKRVHPSFCRGKTHGCLKGYGHDFRIG